MNVGFVQYAGGRDGGEPLGNFLTTAVRKNVAGGRGGGDEEEDAQRGNNLQARGGS